MHFTLISIAVAGVIAGIFLVRRLRGRNTKKFDVQKLADASVIAANVLIAETAALPNDSAAVRATAQAILGMVQDLPVRVRNLEADMERVSLHLGLS